MGCTTVTCNLGKDLVGAGTHVLPSWEEGVTGEGTALTKPVAVLPSRKLPLVTRQRTLHRALFTPP